MDRKPGAFDILKKHGLNCGKIDKVSYCEEDKELSFIIYQPMT